MNNREKYLRRMLEVSCERFVGTIDEHSPSDVTFWRIAWHALQGVVCLMRDERVDAENCFWHAYNMSGKDWK